MPSPLLTGIAVGRNNRLPQNIEDYDNVSVYSGVAARPTISGMSQVVGKMRNIMTITIPAKPRGPTKETPEIPKITLEDFEPKAKHLKKAANSYPMMTSSDYEKVRVNFQAYLPALHNHSKTGEIVVKIAYLLNNFKESRDKASLTKYMMMFSIVPIEKLVEFTARAEETGNKKVISLITGEEKKGYWEPEVIDIVFKYDRSKHGDIEIVKGRNDIVKASNLVNRQTAVITYWQNTLRQTLVELSGTEPPTYDEAEYEDAKDEEESEEGSESEAESSKVVVRASKRK